MGWAQSYRDQIWAFGVQVAHYPRGCRELQLQKLLQSVAPGHLAQALAVLLGQA